MTVQQVLIAGEWRDADYATTFQAVNPSNREPLPDQYPVSSWRDCDACLAAAKLASAQLASSSAERPARFLEVYADRIERRAEELVEMAQAETALPKSPRLADVELPRTTGQIRQAAAAAREGSWAAATIDTKNGIRSMFRALGPICVFGPNNFPFAFGSISGGDFAAAIAAGNPVIAKANSSHPGTTRLFAEEAEAAARESDMPVGTVQLIYRLGHEDGKRLVADPRVGATGYTGSRAAGLELKAAADAAGKPIYLELSSVNPVVILPRALEERSAAIADDFTSSCLMGTGQFCTNPGLVILLRGSSADEFVNRVGEQFQSAPVGTLLSASVATNLAKSLAALRDAGAELIVGGNDPGGANYSLANSLLRVEGDRFLRNSESLQTEAFGNCSLMVVASDLDQVCDIADSLEGNLTGCVYSAANGQDDDAYDRIAKHLRQRVGRLLNDKMPTGVAVSPAMNHGGPFPATGHPGFTAVGIPAAMPRFAMLQCYDNVRPHRLPPALQDESPAGNTWRCIDGRWTKGSVNSGRV